MAGRFPWSTLHAPGGVKQAVAYTSILAVGHFISTLAAVFVIWFLGSSASMYLDYLKLGVGVLLLLLAAKGFLGLCGHIAMITIMGMSLLMAAYGRSSSTLLYWDLLVRRR